MMVALGPHAAIADAQRLIGQRIRATRKRVGWTLEDLAQRSHLAVSTLQRYESGQHVHRFAVLYVISASLGVPLAELVTNLDQPESVPAAAKRRVTERLDHTPEQRRLLEIWTALPREKRTLILEFGELILRRHRVSTTKPQRRRVRKR